MKIRNRGQQPQPFSWARERNADPSPTIAVKSAEQQLESREGGENKYRTRQGSRKHWLKLGLFLALVLTQWTTPAVTAQTRRLRVVRVQIQLDDDFPEAIQFFCAQLYKQDHCKKDVLALRGELARYPVEQLGLWSFVLVPSGDWRDLVRDMIRDPGSPAITMLEHRTTVFEEALFSASGSRRGELLRKFKIPADALLELAVSHELGHALCQEKDEHRTNTYSRYLRERQSPACHH
jgi:hypothetical protein